MTGPGEVGSGPVISSFPINQMATKKKKSSKSPVDWSKLSKQEIWDALKAAPKIAGAWYKSKPHKTNDGYDVNVNEEWRSNANGDIIATAYEFIDEFRASYRSDLDIEGYLRTTHKTMEQAKRALDEQLKKDGWILLD